MKRPIKILLSAITFALVATAAHATDYTFGFGGDQNPRQSFAYIARTGTERYEIQTTGYTARNVRQKMDSLFTGYDTAAVYAALAHKDSITCSTKLKEVVAQLFVYDMSRIFPLFLGDSIKSVDLHWIGSAENHSGDSFTVYMKVPTAGHLFMHKSGLGKWETDTTIKNIAGYGWFADNSFCGQEMIVRIEAEQYTSSDTIEIKTDFLELIFHTFNGTSATIPLTGNNRMNSPIQISQLKPGSHLITIRSTLDEEISVFNISGDKISAFSIRNNIPTSWSAPVPGVYLFRTRKAVDVFRVIVK